MAKKQCTTRRTPGHFGLAFKHYTHFTHHPSGAILIFLCTVLLMNTRTECRTRVLHFGRRILTPCANILLSVSAEQRKPSVHQPRLPLAVLAKAMIGEIHEGVVSGVMRFGIFIELTDIPIEGLIKIRQLGEESFAYDERSHSLTGRSTRNKIQLGDKFRVKIVRVDLEEREVDFEIVREGSSRERSRSHHEADQEGKDIEPDSLLTLSFRLYSRLLF